MKSREPKMTPQEIEAEWELRREERLGLSGCCYGALPMVPVVLDPVEQALKWADMSGGYSLTELRLKTIAEEVRRLRQTKMKTRKLWHLDITLTPTETKKWNQNERLAIAADTLEEAVQKAREVYPTATFWKINHGGTLHLDT